MWALAAKVLFSVPCHATSIYSAMGWKVLVLRKQKQHPRSRWHAVLRLRDDPALMADSLAYPFWNLIAHVKLSTASTMETFVGQEGHVSAN